MSIHEARVIKIPKIEKHPDADKLGLVKVYDWTVVIGLEHWTEGQLAAYIEPDTLCDLSIPDFAFLKDKEGKTHHRVKVKRLRGIYSQGCLVPAPEGFNEGDDVWDHFKLERYEPQTHSNLTKGTPEKGPSGIVVPKYDLDNFAKYSRLFQDGETVWITEKLHGANARFTYAADPETGEKRMFYGSRTEWKKPFDPTSPKELAYEDPKTGKQYFKNEKPSMWQQIAEKYPVIEKMLKEVEGAILYGEIYGQVQDLKYGTKQNEILFAAFDIMKDGKWFNVESFFGLCGHHDIPVVPVLYTGPYSKEVVLQHTEGNSTIPGSNHTREGCVIKPYTERYDDRLGRVALKSVSNAYLEKSK